MNINRHNYESFFLLYVDNELSAAERKTVDIFVNDNPDLREELSLLQASILKPSSLSFDLKEQLFRESITPFQQEQLICFLDGELSLAESKAIENLLANDPVSATEYKILQSAKLVPEKIVFENKAALYRTTGGRVIAFRRWRTVAAAILLGFGIWGGITLMRNESTNNTVTNVVSAVKDQPVKENTTTGNSTKVKTPVDNNTTVAKPGLNNNDGVSVTVRDQDQPGLKTPTYKMPEGEKRIAKITIQEADPSSLENINNTGSNNLPISSVALNKKSNTNSTDETLNGAVQQPTENSTNIDPIPVNSFAQNAVYTNTVENNNDRFLYMNEDKVKRSKLGGLIRKVKRVVGRNMDIKSGNGIKVAGFEIAIK